MNKKTFYFLLLVITAISLNIPSIKSGYIFDDQEIVKKDYSFGHFTKQKLSPASRPVRYLSFLFDYKLYKGAPEGYHKTNIFLHLIVSILLFIFLQTFFNTDISFIITLLFISHPIIADSVIPISHRKEMLYGIFILLSLLLYIQKNIYIRYLSILIWFIAILSKETAIILPFLFLIYDLFYRKNEIKKNRYIYIIFSFLFLMAIIWVFKDNRFDIKSFSEILNENRFFKDKPIWSVFISIPYAIFIYLTHIFIPYNLVILDSIEPLTSIISLHFIEGVFALLILLFGIIYGIKKNYKNLSFGLLWFILFYLPVSGLLPVAYLVADRYMYIPIIGIFIAVFSLLKNYKIKYILSATLIIIGIFSILYIQRERIYSNPVLLWEKVVNKYPSSQIGWNNYGLELMRIKKYTQAEKAFLNSIKSDPEYYKAFNNLGALYNKMGDYKNAKWNFMRAYEIEPQDPRPLYFAGIVSLKMNDSDGAMRIFNYMMFSKHYNFAPFWFAMGIISSDRGQYKEAIGFLKRSLVADSSYKNAADQLARLYIKIGDTLSAERVYKKYIMNK